LAAHLLSVYGANVVLLGRSQLAPGAISGLESLARKGGNVRYVMADVGDASALRATLQSVVAQFGAIHGVLHAAGLASTESIATKDIRHCEEILTPKIAGTLALEEALEGTALDFVCYFSSSCAVLGDFGGCDYAVGSRFQVAHARYRNTKHGAARSTGATIAIQWPLWLNGGMKLGDEQTTELYLRSSGQSALGTQEGIALFERLLGAPQTQFLVMKGIPARVHAALGVERIASSLTVEQRVVSQLQDLASTLLKIPRGSLTLHANLADIGFDSLSLAEFAERLTAWLGVPITPSVFFSHATLEKLARYFVREHAHAVVALSGSERKASPVAPSRSAAVVPVQTARTTSEPIAIIGMSGRFPGARTVDELWKRLVEGQSAIEEIPPARFDWRKYYCDAEPGKVPPGKINSKWLGAIEGVDEFDAPFFEISPNEADLMDPRQRLLLQEAWNALEDAGYGSRQLEASRVGMFVGVEQGDYQQLIADSAVMTATHEAILAARLAYFLDLRGPVLALNTACSSGLVAAHQACMSLRAGECDTAIAASANLLLTPGMYVAMSQAAMLSPDGRCFAFDRRANGMVPGEAVVALVLKTLSRAQADNDPIHAVIRGSGINYDGRTNGITAPGGVAQKELVMGVYEQAQVRAEDVQYIVAHGTGSRLGDPVEINALHEAFRSSTQARAFCAVTSPKANLGHAFAASGLVSLVTLVQALRHEMIPRSVHCEVESDYFDWQASPFFINKENRPWPRQAAPRLGAVSAFGISGTNAHMVVESYDRQRQIDAADAVPVPGVLIALSAKTEAALLQKAQDLLNVLRVGEWSAQSLSAMSYTLVCCRHHFRHRCAMVVDDHHGAIAALESLIRQEPSSLLFRGRVDRDFAGDAAVKHEGEDLRSLASLYCQGYELSWDRLYGKPEPLRIRLPGYPFARERHWVRSSEVPRPSSAQVLTFAWERREAPAARTEVERTRGPVRHHVLFCEGFGKPEVYESYERHVRMRIEGVRYERLRSASDDLAQRFEELAGALLERVRDLMQSAPRGPVLLQLVVSEVERDEQSLLQGLAGLLKTARLENPEFRGQLIGIESGESATGLVEKLHAGARCTDEHEIRYRDGVRHVRRLQHTR
jgi:polyketide synthase PksN